MTITPDPILTVFGLLVVLALPGAAVSVWMVRPGQDALDRLADAFGFSISLTAVLGLFFFLVNFKVTQAVLIGLYIFCGLVFLMGWAWGLRHRSVNLWEVAFLLGAALLVTWKLFQAHGLALPAWVDSVHHTLVVQKIMASAGLPETLGPELDVPFFYHFSFHLVTALAAVVAHLQASQAVLLVGQVLNAAAAFSIYRLGKVLFDDRKKAVVAALLAGVATQMPGFYLAWGRYTLLAGMVVLPLAMAALVELARKPTGGRMGLTLRLELLVAGLCLSHYLTILLFGLFLVCLVVKEGLSNRSFERVWGMLWPSLVGGLLAFPWLLRAWLNTSRYAGVDVVSPAQPGTGGYFLYLLGLLGPARNDVICGIALIGLALLLWKPGRRWFGAWCALLVLLASPWGLRVDPFRPDYFAIILYLPVALLAAFALLEGMGWLESRTSPVIGRATLGTVLVGLCLWGLLQTGSYAYSGTILADRADLNAIEWVREHTPLDARFLINAQPWQTASYRGVDGGYWLLTLTGRQTELPPAMYGYGDHTLIQTVNDRAQAASQLKDCTDDFWRLVKEAQLTYIYIKQGVGALQPENLSNCQNILPVYRKDGIYIFQITGE